MAKTVDQRDNNLFGAFKKNVASAKPETKTEIKATSETVKEKKAESAPKDKKPEKEAKEYSTSEDKGFAKSAKSSEKKEKASGETISFNNLVLPAKQKSVKERKSVQRTILVKPSQFEKVMSYADEYGISFNDFICRMIDALPEG